MTQKIALAILLAASTALPAMAQETRTITGEIAYLQRIALPEVAQVRAEVRGPHDVLLAQYNQPTGGAQVPLPFALEIPDDVTARLTVSIAFEGQVRWLAPSVDLPLGGDDIALGTLQAAPFVAAGFTSSFNCEGEIISAGFVNDTIVITREDGSQRIMPQVIAASGAKFADPDNPDQTFFWNKGDNATMRMDGILSECAVVADAQAAPWRASGFEPGWLIEITGDNYTLTRMDEDDVIGVLPEPTWQQGAVVWAISNPEMQLRAAPEVCYDNATGMPHPETVSLTLGDGTVLQGCGGSPASLLQGETWRVTDLNDLGVPSDGDGLIRFAADGSVSGQSFCNNFIGSYEIGGEAISMGHLASTLKICGAQADYREEGFLKALRDTVMFSFDASGGLELRDLAGTVIIRASR
ncbi:META domain-containing protein [Ketogulonicigenium vulgare]|uniref:META domain-containing protein n=1 Tax=Ketogulonicigenium vulgare TaxID=92945 RepID=UPI002359EEB7|nr:META domain-containing protein [Ketogulonicigenium vulgare]